MTLSATQDGIPHLVDHLCRAYSGRITGHVILPAQAGVYADFPASLTPHLQTALRHRGVQQLYRHQRQAWDSIQAGQHTVIVTPTASGKTLCYNLPVLHAALEQRAKALYLFPTKALSQNQVAELTALNQAGDLGLRAYTFDGDTRRMLGEPCACTAISSCRIPTCCTRASCRITPHGHRFSTPCSTS